MRKRLVISRITTRVQGCPTAGHKVRYFHNCEECLSHSLFDGAYVHCIHPRKERKIGTRGMVGTLGDKK